MTINLIANHSMMFVCVTSWCNFTNKALRNQRPQQYAFERPRCVTAINRQTEKDSTETSLVICPFARTLTNIAMVQNLAHHKNRVLLSERVVENSSTNS